MTRFTVTRRSDTVERIYADGLEVRLFTVVFFKTGPTGGQEEVQSIPLSNLKSVCLDR